MRTFKDFVEFSKGKPDSLHGNKGVDSYSLIVNKEYIEDEYSAQDIKTAESITGEKSLWNIDKGYSALREYFDKTRDSDDVEIIGGLFIKIPFEEGINFYRTFGNIYMNARRIVLPPYKKLELEKAERLYIIQWFPRDGRYRIIRKGSELYKLPVLRYPEQIKDLLGWLKKRKKLKTDAGDFIIWNKSLNLSEYRYELRYSDYLPMKNLKTESDLVKYNEWADTELKKIVEEFNKKSVIRINPEKLRKLDPIIDVPITQADVDLYVSEYNNRFRIEAG